MVDYTEEDKAEDEDIEEQVEKIQEEGERENNIKIDNDNLPNPAVKQQERALLQEKIQEFLRKGGKIK